MSSLSLKSPSGDSRRAFLLAFLESVVEEEESWIGEVAEREEKKKRGEDLVNWVVVVVVGWRSGRRRV